MANSTKFEISVNFSRDTDHGNYNDCLKFSLEDFFSGDVFDQRLIDDDAIEELIATRINNWISILDAANNQSGPTEDGEDNGDE